MLVMGSTIFLLILAHFYLDAEVWETGKEGGLGGSQSQNGLSGRGIFATGLQHKSLQSEERGGPGLPHDPGRLLLLMRRVRVLDLLVGN